MDGYLNNHIVLPLPAVRERTASPRSQAGSDSDADSKSEGDRPQWTTQGRKRQKVRHYKIASAIRQLTSNAIGYFRPHATLTENLNDLECGLRVDAAYDSTKPDAVVRDPQL